MAKQKKTISVKVTKTKTATVKTKSKRAVKSKIGKPVEQLISAIIKGIEEKKGSDVVTLNLSGTGNSVADYFVICHASNKIQCEAIVKSVEEQVYKILKEKAYHVEGKQNAEWVLIDYFNVVVHIFTQEKREFYNLEHLWADGINEKIAAHK